MVAPRIAGALAGVFLLTGAGFHPMHTSSAELTYARGGTGAVVTVRVFTDDFASLGGTDPERAGRVRDAIRLTARGGAPVALQLRSARRVEDVVELTLVAAPVALAGGRLRDEVLFGRYGDQINIVRVTVDGRTSTMLFTRGSGGKGLP